MKSVKLYHYTCEHGYLDITRTGYLKPFPHPFMPALGPLVWLTDLEDPAPEAVGLTAEWVRCNRLLHRYWVQTKAATHWNTIRLRAPREVVADLELFGDPAHWWVVRRVVLASEFGYDATWKPKPMLFGESLV